MTVPLPVPDVETQLAFSVRLAELSSLQLGAALAQAVAGLSVPAIDAELELIVGADRLSKLASMGLRGEVLFAMPLVLRKDPHLLAYYRLLLGLSQKEFSKNFSKFRLMETKGILTQRAEPSLAELCARLCDAAWTLVDNLSEVSIGLIRDLQLLTLGAQLRGSRLNEIGKAAVQLVFNRIRSAIADGAVLSESQSVIVLRNSAGREVTIAFSSDPDIAVTEQLGSSRRNVLAVEVKGGTDRSNIHNRMGEAEKSHQKAKAKGYVEFWTIINAVVDPATALSESPTTNQVFDLARIIDTQDTEWARFRDFLTSRLGVPAAS